MGVKHAGFEAELNSARGDKVETEKPSINIGGNDFSPKQSNSVNVLGLSGADSLLIGNYGDSEVLTKFVEAAKKIKQVAKIDFKIFQMDLEKFDLGFSHAVFAFKGDNGKVYWFSALLEATGRKPLEVKTIVENMQIKNSTDVLVTADAFDDTFFNNAEILLTRGYNVKKEDLVSCEGVVIPANANIEVTGDVVARYTQDVMASRYLKDTKANIDVNVPALVHMSKGGHLNLDLSFNTGSTINMVGRNVRSDYNVEVNIVKSNNRVTLNGQGGATKIATTSGFLEYIVDEERHPYTGVIKRVATPMFILNEFIGKAPTINYALLSIINSATFTNRNVLRTMIIEKDAGPLNFLFNYGGDGTKYGDKMSFKDPKADPMIIDDIIAQHIKATPIFALDIEEYGTDFSYMYPFSALIDMSTRQQANTLIIKAASELVGRELNMQDVAADECSYVPLGEFLDGDGNVRDIREIDTTFISTYIKEPSILIDWIFSNAPRSSCIALSGKDPYVLKLEVINKVAAMLNIKPVITGRAVRVVLNGSFVNELVTAAMANGYNPNSDNPNISYNGYNNLQAIANVYSNAAIGSLGFGTAMSRQGYTMPFGVNYGNFGR